MNVVTGVSGSERGGKLKVILAAFTVLLILSIFGNAGCSPSPPGTSGHDGVAKEDLTDYLLKFVDEYNAIADVKIAPGERFSPHDKDSPYYRIEFRLGAYNESLGMAATCGDVSVLIVNYGKQNEYSPENTDFRVYASGPTDQVTTFYRISAKVLDPSVSGDAVEAAIDDSSKYGGNGETIQGSHISTTLLFRRDTLEVMLDTSKYVEH